MSEDISKRRKQSFCLYAFYGDATESKLAFLCGTRDYQKFRDNASDFMFNMFKKDYPEQNAIDECNLLTEYVLELQLDYAQVLSKLPKAWGYSQKPIISTPNRAAIQQNHQVLCEIDGTTLTDGKFLDCYEKRIHEHSFDPTILDANLEKILAASQESFSDLGEVERCATMKGIKLYHSPTQAIQEFAMYFSHLARIYRGTWETNFTNPNDEVRAAIGHLKRVTLDMDKSIVVTAMQNFPNAFDGPQVTALLNGRQTEVQENVGSPAKHLFYRPYAQAAKAVFDN